MNQKLPCTLKSFSFLLSTFIIFVFLNNQRGKFCRDGIIIEKTIEKILILSETQKNCDLFLSFRANKINPKSYEYYRKISQKLRRLKVQITDFADILTLNL